MRLFYTINIHRIMASNSTPANSPIGSDEPAGQSKASDNRLQLKSRTPPPSLAVLLDAFFSFSPTQPVDVCHLEPDL